MVTFDRGSRAIHADTKMARSTLIAVVAIACVAVTHALAGETADAESWNVDAVFATGDTNGDSVLDKHEFAWTMKHFGFEPKSSPAASADSGAHVDGGEGEAHGFFELSGTRFWEAFTNSLLMIFATEIGDKTFFIAAVLAMRQSRATVFAGAIGALALMTVLSAIMGFALPNLMPRKYTHYASAALFVYFGVKLIKDAGSMGDGPNEELQEVEDELFTGKRTDSGGDADGGEAASKDPVSKGHGSADGGELAVLTQAFTLTFLAEWGDRSQIATIALAAAKDPIGVTIGGIIGHSICTGVAVIGGRMLAARISERMVAYVGGSLFLCFSVHALFFSSM